MKTTTGLLTAGAVASTFVAVAALSTPQDIPVTGYYCATNQPGKYPVQILASDNSGAVLREGGVKRFEINEEAGTCAYTDKSGDTMIFHMK